MLEEAGGGGIFSGGCIGRRRTAGELQPPISRIAYATQKPQPEVGTVVQCSAETVVALDHSERRKVKERSEDGRGDRVAAAAAANGRNSTGYHATWQGFTGSRHLSYRIIERKRTVKRTSVRAQFERL
jgi:hypothetical protein